MNRRKTGSSRLWFTFKRKKKKLVTFSGNLIGLPTSWDVARRLVLDRAKLQDEQHTVTVRDLQRRLT